MTTTTTTRENLEKGKDKDKDKDKDKEGIIDKDNPTDATGARTIRNFRTATDIESFYRFVNNNDLRREAKLVLEVILNKVASLRKKKNKAANAKAKNLH
jgi:hypothetical protein